MTFCNAKKNSLTFTQFARTAPADEMLLHDISLLKDSYLLIPKDNAGAPTQNLFLSRKLDATLYGIMKELI